MGQQTNDVSVTSIRMFAYNPVEVTDAPTKLVAKNEWGPHRGRILNIRKAGAGYGDISKGLPELSLKTGLMTLL